MLDSIAAEVLDPRTVGGALAWALAFLVAAVVLASAIGRLERHVDARLSDSTGLRYASAFARMLAYLVAFILYAHIVPELRALGTALLAGVGVVSVVVGLAAQSTLSNLVAGLSLVLYRPIRVGERIQLTTPRGLATGTVDRVSLGYTVLRGAGGEEIVVPNTVMASSVVIRLAAQEPPGR